MGLAGGAAGAGRHPDLVQRRLAGAALLNTGMSELTSRVGFLGPRIPGPVSEAILKGATLTQLAWPARLDPIGFHLTRRAAFGPRTTAGRVAFAHEMFAGTRPAVRAGFGHTFLSLDLIPSVQRLNVPTLLISGRLDLLLPVWHSEQLAATLPNLVEYAELAEVGHTAPLEAPEEVTPRIGRLARACLVGTAAARRPIAASV